MAKVTGNGRDGRRLLLPLFLLLAVGAAEIGGGGDSRGRPQVAVKVGGCGGKAGQEGQQRRSGDG